MKSRPLLALHNRQGYHRGKRDLLQKTGPAHRGRLDGKHEQGEPLDARDQQAKCPSVKPVPSVTIFPAERLLGLQQEIEKRLDEAQ